MSQSRDSRRTCDPGAVDDTRVSWLHALIAQEPDGADRIGLVPQDDILHAQLTVRSALRHAARLRFPGDTHELGLSHRAENRITALSGGQRKRVSVAVELRSGWCSRSWSPGCCDATNRR